MRSRLQSCLARPGAIKLAPFARALRCEAWANVVVVGVRQHRALLDQALADAEIAPDVDLAVGRETQSLVEPTSRLLTAIDAWLQQRPIS